MNRKLSVMKKLLLAGLVLVYLQNLPAQTLEGKITYEQKVDLHRRIPETDQQTRAMVPPTRTSKFELQFADNQSIYKAVEEEPDMTEPPHGGGVVIRIGGAAENEYYKNFTTRKVVEKRELLQDTYLLQDSLPAFNWKLENGETKTIAGFTCKKATGKTERGTEVIAWYAEDIPVASGPEQFCGLPGIILALDANKGEIVFTAVSVDKKADRKGLKAPVQGKKVTGAEFAKIQKDLMGNGPVRIVTN